MNDGFCCCMLIIKKRQRLWRKLPFRRLIRTLSMRVQSSSLCGGYLERFPCNVKCVGSMLISCSGYCVGAQLIIKLNYESITHICPSDIRLWLDGGDH